MNKFMYKIGVSRVQIRFSLRSTPVFIIFLGNCETNICLLHFKADKFLNFELKSLPAPYDEEFSCGFRMVQIGSKAYVTVSSSDELSQCIELAFDARHCNGSLGSQPFKCRERANLLFARHCHAACSSDNDTHLVVTGNMPNGDDNSLTKKAERFDIRRNKWTELPELNVGRSQHSSCSVGSATYVFCGLSSPDWSVLSSIEKLETSLKAVSTSDKSAAAESAAWKLINLPDMIGRVSLGVARLNYREVLIMGGVTDSE